MKRTICLLIFIVGFFSSTAKPLDSYQRYRFVGEPMALEEYRKNIYDCLLDTARCVTDVNADGQVNCQDWSITFKAVWYASYCNYQNTCILVTNQCDKMNHMFIAVRPTIFDKWEFIEPQAFKDRCDVSYFMEDYWGSSYNPVFNKLGK